eukprot:TRINITY_DN33897_c0_g1_i1.p1 TRINITY_DN33897_c0_g1~~TRINITY_DN33897_c0_g1_i1.p1  ORF type:complete len:233 (-),score=52.43 TRINITY_DN33897_c0_g1_i1:496-1140(-)
MVADLRKERKYDDDDAELAHFLSLVSVLHDSIMDNNNNAYTVYQMCSSGVVGECVSLLSCPHPVVRGQAARMLGGLARRSHEHLAAMIQQDVLSGLAPLLFHHGGDGDYVVLCSLEALMLMSEVATTLQLIHHFVMRQDIIRRIIDMLSLENYHPESVNNHNNDTDNTNSKTNNDNDDDSHSTIILFSLRTLCASCMGMMCRSRSSSTTRSSCA